MTGAFWDRVDALLLCLAVSVVVGSCTSACCAPAKQGVDPEVVRLRQEVKDAHATTAACLAELVSDRAITENVSKRFRQCTRGK